MVLFKAKEAISLSSFWVEPVLVELNLRSDTFLNSLHSGLRNQ